VFGEDRYPSPSSRNLSQGRPSKLTQPTDPERTYTNFVSKVLFNFGVSLLGNF
jgi:hypothetical protein